MTALRQFIEWIAHSPPIFTPNAPFTSFQELGLSAPDQLDEYFGNPRLGFIYQHLCQILLQHSDQFELLYEEIQINDPEGRTVGAIDFILHNHEKNRQEHWEVAIKFYLLHKGLWYGPNAHDRLDKKLDRMLNHQLTLVQQPLFKTLYPDCLDLSPQLLMQGRLYYNPFNNDPIPQSCLGHPLNPNQINGYWCYEYQLAQIPEPIYPLEKLNWASGHLSNPSPLNALKTRFVHAISESGRFWFVVPDTWPYGA